MIYLVHAGDGYGPHQEFLLEGPGDLDLARLEAEFEKTLPQLRQIPGFTSVKERAVLIEENRISAASRREILLAQNNGLTQDFLFTRCFVTWLCNHHGCSEIIYVFHCTEN